MSCGSIKVPLLYNSPQVQITETQFDCGPKPQSLPEDAALLEMTDMQLFRYYVDAYKWGERCDTLLRDNQTYFKESLADRAAKITPPTKK